MEEVRHRAIPAIAAAAILIILPTAAAFETVDANTERTETVGHDEWDAYRVNVPFGNTVTVAFEAEAIVDFYVFTQEQYADYTNPSVPQFQIVYPREWTTSFTYSTGTSGYVFVVDNANITTSGAAPQGAVDYSLTVAYVGMSAGEVLSTYACPLMAGLVILLAIGTTYWMYTPPKSHREVSKQLRAVLK